MISPFLLGVITTATFWPNTLWRIYGFLLLQKLLITTRIKLCFYILKAVHFMPKSPAKKLELVMHLHIYNTRLQKLKAFQQGKED